eukprot:TRINITY_DN31072_c0_g1_i1.p1 TRINITY_DN31072_c0_g1~~TRINITY_DN31072_c0_g1_i1.p1  ORF type:complete len:246 (+),score=54.63 TRINITY_DN31072_c0_g1_i1:80-817(+)
MSFTGKVAIVTGASSGIGKAIAEKLAAEGATVVITYSGNAQGADSTLAAVRAKNAKALAVQADFSKPGVPATAKNIFDEAEKAFGKVDLLVNNAGYNEVQAFGSSTEDVFDKLFNINAKGPYFLLNEAATRLTEGGSIVNISTGGTKVPWAGGQGYNGAKAALEIFSKVAAKEFAARNISVNVVSPGYTDTAMLADQIRAYGASQSVYKRLGTPDEIASVVAFLLGPSGHWVTAENILATGGAAL